MPGLDPLSLLSGPMSVPGGGAGVPSLTQSANSSAESSLNSSGSVTKQSSGAFNFKSSNNLPYILAAGVAALFLLLKRK